MIKKERNIIIEVVYNKNININRLAEFFARKYSEKNNERKIVKKRNT